MDWSITAEFPRGPGVYIFKDAYDTPIYVGMATNLRTRVRSYARDNLSSGSEGKKIQAIQAGAVFVEYISADDVLGAKIMEDYLIFYLQPPLNGVMLPIKYNYLKITCEEQFPCLLHTKDISSDGGVYFGPFHSFSRSKDVVFDLRRIFKIRTCEGSHPGQQKHNNAEGCLNYEAGHCLGPCRSNNNNGASLSLQYRENVDKLLRVLSGDVSPLIEIFSEKMQTASKKLDFETAAVYQQKQDRILRALRRKKMRLLGPTDLNGILMRVQEYVSEKLPPTRVRPGYSRWE